MIKLRDYQIKGTSAIFNKFSNGVQSIVYQLPTGAGKTVTFCNITSVFTREVSNKDVLIIVHREELLKQTIKSLKRNFDIRAESIMAGRSIIPKSRVYVAMIETLNNLLQKSDLNNIGLVIIDECHIGNFKKIYDYFPKSFRLGFSATPISADKKDPLKNQFQDIVIGPQIYEMIANGNLCQNITYEVKNIARSNVKVKNKEFDQKQMSSLLSKSKHVHNTVEAYKKFCNKEKTIIFNSGIEHSLLVTQAFNDAGFPCRHIDGEMKDDRTGTFDWFRDTHNAILCNVGVATTGFDEPTVKNVIINKLTMSLPLWLQMTGRGSRPINESIKRDIQRYYPYELNHKDFFRIIDMGGNASYHGDWSVNRDWETIFHEPEKPFTGEGQAPSRKCLNCGFVLPAQIRSCIQCGFTKIPTIVYDMFEPEFKKVVDNIDVSELVEAQRRNNSKKYSVFFNILNKTIALMRYRIGDMEVDEQVKYKTYKIFEKKVIEWCRINDEPFSKYIKEFSELKFNEEFDKNIKRTA